MNAIYHPKDLSNEQYQQLPQISGSTLVKIHSTCPAKFKYGERKETKALHEGTVLHCAVLEPERFFETYQRAPVLADYPGALVTAKDIESALKQRGIKGYSGKSKDELIQFAIERCDDLIFWDKIVSDAADSTEKELIDAVLFDKAISMRGGIDDQEIIDLLSKNPMIEHSIIFEDRKVRPDVLVDIGDSFVLMDYKSTINANPDKFGKQAHDLGYWLKMAYQKDVIESLFQKPVSRVILLAQEKELPYLSQAYELTEQQLQVGREQYESAVLIYKNCESTGNWGKYASGILQLPTPQWVERDYGFNEVEGEELNEH